MDDSKRLPSISIGSCSKKKISLSSNQFLNSLPVLRRDRINLLFEDSEISDDKINYQFSRVNLRTPPEIRKAVEGALLEYRISKNLPRSNNPSVVNNNQYSIQQEDFSVKSSSSKAFNVSPNRTPQKDTKIENDILSFQKASKYLLSPEEKTKLNRKFIDPVIESKFELSIHSPNHIKSYKQESEINNITSNNLSRELSSDEIKNYIGKEAFTKFNDIYKTSSALLNKCPSDNDIPENLRSPRSMFLREITKKNLLPIPIILRDETNSKGLFLAHKGLGDEYLLSIIRIIETLPIIEAIDLCDNRLTDESITPLAEKLPLLKHLSYLNLSANDVDESSNYLMNYLQSPECNLKQFYLDASDVDDIECANISTAMLKNTSLVSLSLCRNKIGDMELLNVVMPDLITGGEALGAMLEGNHTLKELDLRWNSLRLNSAVILAKSLRINDSLVTLKLGNNAFGELATETLGMSLKYNKTLTYLDLSYNSLNPKATTVIANSLMYNHVLKEIILDGNVLGRVGTQSLVASVQRAAGDHRTLEISFNNCDCEKVDKRIFDPANPAGIWKLDLSDPYGQMVIEECIFLCNHKSGCSLGKLILDGIPVNLIHSENTHEKKNHFHEVEFRKLSSSFSSLINQEKYVESYPSMLTMLEMFNFKIQKPLLMKIVERVKLNWDMQLQQGLVLPDDLADVLMFEIFVALFQIADSDSSGFVSLDELKDIMIMIGIYLPPNDMKRVMAEFDVDDSGQIDIDEFSNAMVKEFCQTASPKGFLIDKNTGTAWNIPSSGKLTIEMFYKVEKPGIFNVLRKDGMTATLYSLKNAKSSDQRNIIFKKVVSSPYFFLNSNHSQMLFDEMSNGTDADLDIIAQILPQIVNEEHVTTFIDSNLNSLGKLALRVKIGNIYNAFIGNPTGHYIFDLSNNNQRISAKKLSSISVSEANFCEENKINTSQKGVYSSLRNETLDEISVTASGEWFSFCPQSGKLRCDFASTNRPKKGTRSLSDHRFKKFMSNIGFAELLYFQAELTNCTDSAEQNSIISDRFSSFPEFITPMYLRQVYLEYSETSYRNYDSVVYPKERMRDFSRPGYRDTSRPTTPDDMKIEDMPLKKTYSIIFPFAFYKILILQINIPGLYFNVSQVLEILNYFPADDYLRVQVFITLFGRITDLENLFRITDLLFTIDEKTEVYHRIGILNVTDPMYPDRDYRLDLRRWDHREMVKILVKLASAEPGDNWLNVSYRWAKYDEPVPGWLLPVSWTLSDRYDSDGEVIDGPRKHGWICLTYTSEGLGCMPSKAARRFLRNTKTLSGLIKLL